MSRSEAEGSEELAGESFRLVAALEHLGPCHGDLWRVMSVFLDILLAASDKPLSQRLRLQLSLGICTTFKICATRNRILREKRDEDPGLERLGRCAKNGLGRQGGFSHPSERHSAESFRGCGCRWAWLFAWQVAGRTGDPRIIAVILPRDIRIELNHKRIECVEKRIVSKTSASLSRCLPTPEVNLGPSSTRVRGECLRQQRLEGDRLVGAISQQTTHHIPQHDEVRRSFDHEPDAERFRHWGHPQDGPSTRVGKASSPFWPSRGVCRPRPRGESRFGRYSCGPR